MILSDVRCFDCNDPDVVAIWPGKEDIQYEMFRLIPGRPVRAWCEKCWLIRYGQQPRLPRRQRGKVAAEQQ